jgi:multiple antibiotic resistance protein
MGTVLLPFLESFLKAFVPLFFAIDAIGVLPLFVGFTEELDRAERHRILRQSLITAFLVAVGFVLLGKGVFHLMGITISDFAVAGGILLFVIAALTLVKGEKAINLSVSTIGAVPLGTPLIVGPATLTLSLLLIDQADVGLVATLLAIVANIALTGIVFWGADPLTRLLGQAGSRAVAKVASLILAAIAIMMIRRGMPDFVAFVENITGNPA